MKQNYCFKTISFCKKIIFAFVIIRPTPSPIIMHKNFRDLSSPPLSPLRPLFHRPPLSSPLPHCDYVMCERSLTDPVSYKGQRRGERDI